ncbi:hypothetical protein C8R44DRAFT_973672 [Mycena epipterygia]|nr:hypothetical protein C8R44DRAFT_973672 [Mycena epipterygia]
MEAIIAVRGIHLHGEDYFVTGFTDLSNEVAHFVSEERQSEKDQIFSMLIHELKIISIKAAIAPRGLTLENATTWRGCQLSYTSTTPTGGIPRTTPVDKVGDIADPSGTGEHDSGDDPSILSLFKTLGPEHAMDVLLGGYDFEPLRDLIPDAENGRVFAFRPSDDES